MARIPVEIIDLRQQKDSILTEAVGHANRCQSEFLYIDATNQFALELKLHIKSVVNSKQLFDAVEDVQNRIKGYHPCMIVFVDAPLESEFWSNLFSARDSTRGFAVVTTANVVGPIIEASQLSAYYLYEFAVHSLAMITGSPDHQEVTRGCIFDFKEDKRDILISMKSGLICDSCKEWLLKNGSQLSPQQLVAIETLLAETSKFLEPTERVHVKKPRIFLGSSVEGLSIARAIQSELHHDYHIEIWNQNTVFNLGTVTIEALENALDSYSLGVFLFTPDDKTESRKTQSQRARDNVVFEAGLFIGRLGRFRVFIVHPSSVIALPSDLNGLNVATYDALAPNIQASVGPACEAIRQAINAL